MKKPNYKIGHIVKMNAEFLGNPPGTLGYIYETYGSGGVSIISEKGTNIGGFSEDEQAEYLEFVYDSGYRYKFVNVIALDSDHESGHFKNAFLAAKSFMKKDDPF